MCRLSQDEEDMSEWVWTCLLSSGRNGTWQRGYAWMGLNMFPFVGPQCHMTKRICRNGSEHFAFQRAVNDHYWHVISHYLLPIVTCKGHAILKTRGINLCPALTLGCVLQLADTQPWGVVVTCAPEKLSYFNSIPCSICSLGALLATWGDLSCREQEGTLYYGFI